MRISLLLLIIVSSCVGYSQNAYAYHLRIKGMEDTVIYFGHHYGDKQYVIDTIATNEKGEALISGTQPLSGGIYLIVFPKLKNRYFELIINEPKFSLETDTADFIKNMKFSGSNENAVFYKDLQFITAKRKEAEPLREKLKTLDGNSNEMKQVKEQLNAINMQVEDSRKKIREEHSDLFYAKFLLALEDIKIPEAPLNQDGTKDSTFAYRYIRNHYFDNFDFSDVRFLRTNLVHTKVKRYLDNYVPKIPDSINVALDFIIEKASANDEVFKYIVVTMLNEYANSKIMGMDAVYVHLVDTYYKTGRATWVDEAAKVKIISSSDRKKPNLIGKTAPSIVLQDTAGYDIPLYSVNKDYTVIIFWSPDCSHCKKEMPKLDTIYPQLQTLGAEVYAVYSEEEWDKWKKWLREHKSPWINVGNIKMKSPYQLLYDVETTPMIYIIDRDKKIIAKKIGLEQVTGFLRDYQQLQRQGNTVK